MSEKRARVSPRAGRGKVTVFFARDHPQTSVHHVTMSIFAPMIIFWHTVIKTTASLSE